MAQAKKPTPERVFYVQNTVRRVATKAQRRAAPGRQKFTQRVGGGDVLVRRNRTATVTESKLRLHLADFKRRVAMGALLVTDSVGNPIDLDTFEATPAPATLANTKPQFPLDDVRNDPNPIKPPDVSPAAAFQPTAASRGATPDLLKAPPDEGPPVSVAPEPAPASLPAAPPPAPAPAEPTPPPPPAPEPPPAPAPPSAPASSSSGSSKGSKSKKKSGSG